jgi:hypothetical protein
MSIEKVICSSPNLMSRKEPKRKPFLCLSHIQSVLTGHSKSLTFNSLSLTRCSHSSIAMCTSIQSQTLRLTCQSAPMSAWPVHSTFLFSFNNVSYFNTSGKIFTRFHIIIAYGYSLSSHFQGSCVIQNFPFVMPYGWGFLFYCRKGRAILLYACNCYANLAQY